MDAIWEWVTEEVPLGYLGLVIAATVITTAVRAMVAWPPRPRREPAQLSPYEVAMLAGGDKLTVGAVIGAMRTLGIVAPDRVRGRLAIIGPLPAGAGGLERAVYGVLRDRPQSMAALRRDAMVQRALAEVRGQLTADGLLRTSAARNRMRLVSLLIMGAVVALGATRLVTNGSTGSGVSTVALGLAILILVTGLIAAPWGTRAGAKALRTLRREHPHLSPRAAPSWSTYGPEGAALSIGLYSMAAMWAVDPAFAAHAGMPRHASGSGSSGGSDGGGCGSSCSGGSSCGSSCGGGGCGGGS